METEKTKNLNVLDCTLRDGSYEVNFSFTSKDTQYICKNLEETGIKFIEVGHGVGLGANRVMSNKAVQTDEEYMQAASQSIKKAKWGMFCIPGVSKLEDLDLAKSYGMNFIRIGTDFDKVSSSKEFIEKAKKFGFYVFSNFMKSTNCSNKTFKEIAKESISYGADSIYIVDSSGGMFPDQIKDFYFAVKEIEDISVGFHGHNNLGLANYNSIYASEIGLEFIDASLQGLGRSSGNAILESLVLALIKKNYIKNIDYFKLIEIGQKFIKPIIKNVGHRSADLISGFADFHSSYMPLINKISSELSVDPIRLIAKTSSFKKSDIDEQFLRKIAVEMDKTYKEEDQYLSLKDYLGGEQDLLK